MIGPYNAMRTFSLSRALVFFCAPLKHRLKSSARWRRRLTTASSSICCDRRKRRSFYRCKNTAHRPCHSCTGRSCLKEAQMLQRDRATLSASWNIVNGRITEPKIAFKKPESCKERVNSEVAHGRCKRHCRQATYHFSLDMRVKKIRPCNIVFNLCFNRATLCWWY